MKIKIDNTLEQNIQDILDNNGTSIINAIMLAVYPVGSIYMSVNNTNPGTLFGGTWVAWGSGQVPVGVKTTDTDFATVEKTGGAKTASTSYTPAGKNTGTAVTMNAVELTHSGGAVQGHKLTAAESGLPSHHHTGIINDKNVRLHNGGGADSYSIPFNNNNGGYGNPPNTGDAGGTDASSTHSHGFTQPSKHSFTPTTKSITQPTFTGTAATITESTIQPYITCYMWKRTA